MATFRITAYVPDEKAQEFIDHLRLFGSPPDLTLDIYIVAGDESCIAEATDQFPHSHVVERGVKVCPACLKAGHRTWQCTDPKNCRCIICNCYETA